MVYLALLLLTAAAWWVSAQDWFTSWSRTGYWLGVAGGVSMLLLLTYPLRKRWRVTYQWGKAKHWFTAHMVLGVLGPWLILLHSTFRIGSTNAAVALFSMVIVALSGVVGRFLYMRLHAGLRGEKAELGAIKAQLLQGATPVLLPAEGQQKIMASLNDFEAWVLHHQGQQSAPTGHLWRMFVLPWRRRRATALCREDLRRVVEHLVRQGLWSRPQALIQYKAYRKELDAYARAVQRVAQFQVFERLFSLWHIAHLPFVWIMVLCAVFHVVAVHAY
jgi:hypothetical protein